MPHMALSFRMACLSTTGMVIVNEKGPCQPDVGYKVLNTSPSYTEVVT